MPRQVSPGLTGASPSPAEDIACSGPCWFNFASFCSRAIDWFDPLPFAGPVPDGLIRPYGGSLVVVGDEAGDGKTVCVSIRLPDAR